LLKNQHEAALCLADQVMAACGHDVDDSKAFQISLCLAKLTGLLRVHFAQEDECIYPQMEASCDAKTSATARAFREQMGGLGATYLAYSEKWATARKIRSDFDTFRSESSGIFAALARRIERENRELYPLADEMPDESWHRASRVS
jgi:hypothetical protein